MKKLILALALVLMTSVFASASPFVVTDPFPALDVDECVIDLDGSAVSVAPEIVTAGEERCVYNLAGIAEGAHTGSITTVNIWGSGPAVPFTFTKTLPPEVTGISLEK